MLTPDASICPNTDAVYTCKTDAANVFWTALPYFSRILLLRGALSGRDNGTISVILTSTTPFTSTLTIMDSDLLNYTNVTCDTGNGLVDTIVYNRVLGK